MNDIRFLRSKEGESHNIVVNHAYVRIKNGDNMLCKASRRRRIETDIYTLTDVLKIFYST